MQGRRIAHLYLGSTARRGRSALRAIATLVPLLLAFAPAAVEARPKKERLLILPLEHELGKDAERLRPVEDAFRAEAEALGRYRVSPRGEAAALLDSVRSLGLDCRPGDLECLTKAGVVMEIELLAVLRAAASQERLVVSVVLVDVTNGRTRATVNRTLAPGDSLRAVMRGAAIELLAPDRFVGSLVLDVKEPGATVRVDGVSRGTTPLPAAIEGLAPGEHVVHVEKEGLPAVERLVTVRAFESSALSITLTPSSTDAPEAALVDETAAPAPAVAAAAETLRAPQPAPLPVLPIVFGGVAGVSAIAAVGTSIGALVMNERLKDTGLPTSERRDARAPGQMLVLVGATTGVIAVVAAAAAGATWVTP